MLRENWNFHNDIARQLERMALDCFGHPDDLSAKIYQVDAIDASTFVEVMILLLRHKSNMNNDRPDIDEFVGNSATYLGKDKLSIPDEIARNLFERFLDLFNK